MFKRFNSKAKKVRNDGSDVCFWQSFPFQLKLSSLCPFIIAFPSTQWKTKILFKWWATWTFLPQFLQCHVHSFSSFKSNCFQSRVCNNKSMKNKFSLLRRRRRSREELCCFSQQNKKPEQKSTTKIPSRKCKWKSDYTRFSASNCLIFCYPDGLKILIKFVFSNLQLFSLNYMPLGNFREINCCN